MRVNFKYNSKFFLPFFVFSMGTVNAFDADHVEEVKEALSSNYHTPKESCGLESAKKEIQFYHKENFIKDLVKFTFTDNGGFVLYNEDGINHNWEVDGDSLTITRRQLTSGSRTFTIYNLESSPRSANGYARASWNDWTAGFSSLLHEIVNQENFLIESQDSLPVVKVAMACAHKILINATARAQERYLKDKTVLKAVAAKP